MYKICPECQNQIEDLSAKYCFRCGYSFEYRKSRTDMDREEAERQQQVREELAEQERIRQEAERSRLERERQEAFLRQQREVEAEKKRREEEAQRAEEERRSRDQERLRAADRNSMAQNAMAQKPSEFGIPDKKPADSEPPKKGSSKGLGVLILIACVIFLVVGVPYMKKSKPNQTAQNKTDSGQSAVTAETTTQKTTSAVVQSTNADSTTEEEITAESKIELAYVIKDGELISDADASDLNDRIRTLRMEYDTEIMAIVLDDSSMDSSATKEYLKNCVSNYLEKEGFIFIINKADGYYSIGYTSGFELDRDNISGFYDVVNQNLDANRNVEAIYQGIQFILDNHVLASDPYYVEKRIGIHTYEIIVSDLSWTKANQDAVARGGHLVTFETDDEFQYVINLIKKSGNSKVSQYWIGGTRRSDSTAYFWCYGLGADTFGNEILNLNDKYSSYWLDGEPSFRDESVKADEQYMDIIDMGSDGWCWNDAPDDLIQYVSYFSGKIGYIVEYEN